MRTMISQALKESVRDLPDTSGVYFFIGTKKEILYIGKATSLRDRVKSYFSRDIMSARGPLIAKMIEEIVDIKYIRTDSVLEALILEANEIKKHQPYYNSKEKDDRSYNYVVVTREEFPRILLIRGRELAKVKPLYEKNGSTMSKVATKVSPLRVFGPFPHTSELREALKIIRKIFPYRDEKCKIGKNLKPCFPAQLGLCPGPCAGWISKAEYRKNIKHLIMFFEAKKPKLIESLEKDMKKLAKKHKFEEAQKVKRQIYALDHIQDVALIKADSARRISSDFFRIEAYDIAHLSGKETVGVMTVVEDGELSKGQYRKFKIRADKNNDVANLKEVLVRRLGHAEWTLPNLIVVDGGVAQINAAKEVLKERGFNIDVVSVVKDPRHKAREILGKPKSVKSSAFDTLEKSILLANSEAHRFAIKYHRLLRGRGFRI